jgi:hypothetical protein
MPLPSTTGDHATDPTALHRDTLTAIRDALDIPEAAIDGDHHQHRKTLLDRRADAVVEAIRTILAFEGNPGLVRMRVDNLRARTSQLPVTYRRYIAAAKDHPADCQVCGPGCCNPFLGIHGSTPGPHAGAAVAGVR